MNTGPFVIWMIVLVLAIAQNNLIMTVIAAAGAAWSASSSEKL